MDHRFSSPRQVTELLRGTGYLPDERIPVVVHLADRLAKPVLVEGPAGTGKTELAKSIAAATGTRLIRLQCYEGMDEAKALYEWDYRKQLLEISAHSGRDLFGPDFLLTRPLLAAIQSPSPVVLLVDEVDRLDVEAEALLLEVLSDYQVSIPELGTVTAVTTPLVFLTSNGSRELSEALKRRCLFLHLPYPSPAREQEIILARVPGIPAALASAVASFVATLRTLDLKKSPSVSETLDWARTLLVVGASAVDAAVIAEAMPVLLKHQSDIDLAMKQCLTR